MTTSPAGFLTISAGYKFRTGTLKPSLSKPMKRTHSRNNSYNKGYRAYDKQRLLQEINMQIQKQNNILEENRQLKQQINMGANLNEGMKWDHAPKLMIEAIVQENEELMASVRQKQQQISETKKSTMYTDFLQIFTEYSSNRDELSRLKKLYNQKRKKIVADQKMLLKQNALKINSLQSKQEDINRAINKNQYLKDFLENVEEELEHYKNKNRELVKKQKKLTDDVADIKARVNANKPVSKIESGKKSMIKTQDSVFSEAVKTKSSKQRAYPETEAKQSLLQEPRQVQSQQKHPMKDSASHPWPEPLSQQQQHEQSQSETQSGLQSSQEQCEHEQDVAKDPDYQSNEPARSPSVDDSF